MARKDAKKYAIFSNDNLLTESSEGRGLADEK
jgi:hypothetical protein